MIYGFFRQDDCIVGQTTPVNHKLSYAKHFCGPLTDDVLLEHLAGHKRILCFPNHPEGSDYSGQLQALIVDFDDHIDAGPMKKWMLDGRSWLQEPWISGAS